MKKSIRQTENHTSEPDINGFIAVVRPIPDILAYRNRFMDFMFEGSEFWSLFQTEKFILSNVPSSKKYDMNFE